MTQAARARASQSGDAASPRRPRWAAPLVAGLAFGLAYGVTQRLVSLNVGELIRFGQGFDVQVFPGTSLESLRLRFGAADAELRGNLELQQLERQKKDAASKPEPAKPQDTAAPDPLLEPKPADSTADTPPEPTPPEEPVAPPVAPPGASPVPPAPPALPRP